MKPRHDKAVKKNDFPPELISQIREILKKTFKKAASGREIKVRGTVYDKELLVSASYIEKGSIKSLNFIASVDMIGPQRDLMKKVDVVLDSLGSMIEQYFGSEEEIEMPREWSPFKVDKETVYLIFTTENEDLESEADKILESGKKHQTH